MQIYIQNIAKKYLHKINVKQISFFIKFSEWVK